MTINAWPFDLPRSCMVISHRSIVFGGSSILHVTHDLNNRSWQFLRFESTSQEDAALVAFEEIVRIDPTVLEVSDLPLGWRAWRSTKESHWQREEMKAPIVNDP